MAILSSTSPTLLDHAKALDPDGSIAVVAELMSQTNEILQDMSFIEGNLPTGHQMAIRTGLPEGTWRRLYGGVQPSKSTREQITESTGMLEDYNEVDKAEADLNGNTNEFRASEAMATLEGMSQTLTEALIYGSTAINPERLDGLDVRYNSLSAENADNILDAGGTGSDNRSIWLVVWGPQTCFGILPKGSTAGIQVNDKGQVTLENVNGNGGRMEAYRTHFRVDAGLAVKDWRYVVRICNIDHSDLNSKASGSSANLPELMYEALMLPPSLSMGRAAFYMSRDVMTKFGQQLAAGTQASTLTTENVGGVIQTSWHGVPIRRVDRLATDEARIT